MSNLSVIIAAGGTGGHIFSALAFANDLRKNNMRVTLITDNRFSNYRRDKSCDVIEFLAIKSPARGKLAFVTSLFASYVKCWKLFGKHRPKMIVAFGGYPTLPVLLLAVSIGVPIILHESNMVVGRVNKLFVPFARFVTISLPVKYNKGYQDKFVLTGNPVTSDVCPTLYKTPAPGGDINMLVIGGSQGASAFSHVVPKAIAGLPENIRKRIKIKQQCRISDVKDVKNYYRDIGIEPEIDTFFVDIIAAIEQSHLVITRAGSGTITELSTIGRPGIFVPYPFASDDHQMENARYISDIGGGVVMAQKEFTPGALTQVLSDLFSHDQFLRDMAKEITKIKNQFAARKIVGLISAITTK